MFFEYTKTNHTVLKSQYIFCVCLFILQLFVKTVIIIVLQFVSDPAHKQHLWITCTVIDHFTCQSHNSSYLSGHFLVRISCFNDQSFYRSVWVCKNNFCGFIAILMINHYNYSYKSHIPSGLTPCTLRSQPHLSSSPLLQALVTAKATLAADMAYTNAASLVPVTNKQTLSFPRDGFMSI